MKKTKKCDVCGVTSEQKVVYFNSRFNMCLCSKHAAQMYRHGKITDPTARTVKDRNEIILHENSAVMIIRNKTNDIVASALIDLEDVDRVASRKWNVIPDARHVYIYCKTPKHTKLHRFILNYDGDKEIDHINHDTLDNRKANLRIVTRSENASNTNATCIHRKRNAWYFEIVRYGRRFRQGGFKTYEDAEAALRKCKQEVSARVNELLDEYNRQHKVKTPGVYMHYGKYQALYYERGKRYYVGTFNTREEACKAREKFIRDLNTPY